MINRKKESTYPVYMSSMPNVKITVLRRLDPSELFDEMPVTHVRDLKACDRVEDGQEFIVKGLDMPEGFCPPAWVAIVGNVRTMMFGGNMPWLKEKGTTVTCCTDGLRPVIFKLERME
ncbi:hypothetical protein ES703_75603 [subsurface metagenome]